jgi:hypothetical protein
MSRNNTKQNKQSVTKSTCESMLKLSAVAALIGMPAAAMADQVSLSLTSSLGNYSYGNGSENAGEFAATDSTTGVPAGYVLGTTSTGSSFETFCVQNTVFINTGTSYSSTEAQVTGGSPSNEGGIALSEGVAYLYYNFAKGTLSDYDYNLNSGRTTTAGELQAAIWYFMGEPALNGWPSGNPFITLAEDNLSNAFAANGSGGIDYNVSILQLTCDGVEEQNQLILGGNGTGNNQSVPDGGMTLAMLGLGLAGLFFVNFQRTKSVARQN